MLNIDISGRWNFCRARGRIPNVMLGPATSHVLSRLSWGSCHVCHVFWGASVRDGNSTDRIYNACSVSTHFSTCKDCKGLWRSKMHPCAGAMLFMELQTATHVFVHEASVTTHVGKSGVFKSSWDLFDDEPHSRNFEVEGKYMWPQSWFNAVLLPLPLHFKAYIFEIKNISLGPTGSLTERRLRSA